MLNLILIFQIFTNDLPDTIISLTEDGKILVAHSVGVTSRIMWLSLHNQVSFSFYSYVNIHLDTISSISTF